MMSRYVAAAVVRENFLLVIKLLISGIGRLLSAHFYRLQQF